MSKKSMFSEMEERTLDFWDKGKFFERSVSERSEDNEFTFYDGPPFATGLPHYGHILASTIKDAVPRYKTMRGFRVERVWGWDCHGLPIENLVEKELGLKSKKDIEKMGIDKFNQACRESVFKFEKEWKKTIRRIGRWIDMDNAYKTMDNTYIESVWWAFSELYKKDLIYKENRVSLFCPRCSTPLSNFEVAMGESYRDVKDNAVIAKFKLKNERNTYFLVWTTTPWTLPANVALAVNPEIHYLKVKLKDKDEIYIFAETKKNDVLRDLVYPIEDEGDLDMKVEFLGLLKGKRLLGLEYEPLYNFIAPDKPAWKVVAADFVTGEEGTGIVHIAPAFGEDDMNAARENDLPIVLTVDHEAKFLPEAEPFAGLYVKDADEGIIKDLKQRGLLFKEEIYTHSYPHCWRCETPLIYMAQPAWYVNVTKIKSRMKKNNESIAWRPEHLKKGRFGKGIETAPDWNFSRTRYWGAPIPVWECVSCGKREIVGSIEELKQKADYMPDKPDLHRPHVDEIKMKCACGGVMERIPEVFDCWFESGSMPYGQIHYPFENKAWFKENFPADFIAEGQDQTRGWFYTLHVLATALFDKPAFKNVVVNGIVLAEDGRKMSKSLNNFPDPWLIFDRYSVDALRYYLLTSPVIEAENLNFTESNVAEIEKKLLMVLWNVCKFFELYSKEEKVGKMKVEHILDRWIVARFEQMLEEITQSMDNHSLINAARPIQGFVNDLSTWYLRRSRERFKSDDGEDRKQAVATLFWVLKDLSLVMAPFTPFIAEEIWHRTTGRIEDSVHLEDWPEVEKKYIDAKLLQNMATVRDIVSRGLEARARAGIAVRQILSSVSIKLTDKKTIDFLKKESDFINLIKDELNVETVNVDPAPAKEVAVEVDTKITLELEKKGLAREIVRRINSLRKKAGLTIEDRVVVYYFTESDLAKSVFEQMSQNILSETLANEIRAEKPEVDQADEFDKNGQGVWTGIKKV